MKTINFFSSLLLLSFLSSCSSNSLKSGEEDSSTAASSAVNDNSGHMSRSSTTADGMMGAMNKMMQDMHQMKMTGNSTIDFATHLEHHHQGAIDMAQVEIESGDSEMKKKARQILEELKKEIQQLDQLIEKHKTERC